MSNVNDRQVGGSHYATEYQHWDFVIDTNLHYLYGCATKYLTRWRKKNGIQDLDKAVHYLEKAQAAGIGIFKTSKTFKAFEKFNDASFHTVHDILARNAMWEIYNGNNEHAIELIREMLVSAQKIESRKAADEQAAANNGWPRD